MQYLNEILETAVMEILREHKSEIIKSITLNISYDDIEKIINRNEFLLLNNITKIIEEDTSDTIKVKKISQLIKENNVAFCAQ